MATRVKICGITRLDHALTAVEAGADALGFVFYRESPRALTPQGAAKITRRLPPFVAKVGVFVNASQEEVQRAIEECQLDTLQFHGDEPPSFCAGFPALKVMKAFRIADRSSLTALAAYLVDAWLLDSFVPEQRGGSGTRFSWDLAAEAKALGRPIVLAGGLTPENVADAVRQVAPYAVDVSSGVESTPGLKDPEKVRRFIAAARSLPRYQSIDAS